jgi:hypothetical protein
MEITGMLIGERSFPSRGNAYRREMLPRDEYLQSETGESEPQRKFFYCSDVGMSLISLEPQGFLWQSSERLGILFIRGECDSE